MSCGPWWILHTQTMQSFGPLLGLVQGDRAACFSYLQQRVNRDAAVSAWMALEIVHHPGANWGPHTGSQWDIIRPIPCMQWWLTLLLLLLPVLMAPLVFLVICSRSNETPLSWEEGVEARKLYTYMPFCRVNLLLCRAETCCSSGYCSKYLIEMLFSDWKYIILDPDWTPEKSMNEIDHFEGTSSSAGGSINETSTNAKRTRFTVFCAAS